MPATKSERIEFRVTPEQKEQIEHAAALRGLPVSAFLSDTAARAAKETIQETEILYLSDEDRQVFFDALLNPPSPGPQLRKAAQRYRERLHSK